MNELTIKKELALKIFNFVKTTKWNDETADEVVFLSAKKAVFKILNNEKLNFERNYKLVRLIGQSGSGKTSQLLPALNDDGFIKLAVRDFVPYHPLYANLKKDKKGIRELTNGFALKLLSVVLLELISMGANIILEVTLLEKSFEKLLAKQLKYNQYEIVFLALGVSKQLSDSFILKRQERSGRIVKSSSSCYFYRNLLPSLKAISGILKEARCIVWSASSLEPIFDGEIKKASKFVKLGRKTNNLAHSEQKLRSAKKEYLAKNF